MAHAGSFKNHKNAFLNDPKSQKRGFLDLGLMDRLDIAYDDRTKCFQPRKYYQIMTDHTKVTKIPL